MSQGTNERSEIVIGLVTPMGINHDAIANVIMNYFEHTYNYYVFDYRLSSIVQGTYQSYLRTKILADNEYDRIISHIDACNEFRNFVGKGDAVILAAVHAMYLKRKVLGKEKLTNTVHILRTIKHPDEVRTLRDIYGKGFYLLGFTATEKYRKDYLMNEKHITKSTELDELFERDSLEDDPLGQHTSDVFHLSDCFFRIDKTDEWKDRLKRFLELVFANPCARPPNKDEYAMFLAFAASLRSGDLSRQVGSVIMSQQVEIIATGVNDAPKCGGGQYWTDDGENDHRDLSEGTDKNEEIKRKLKRDVLRALGNEEKTDEELLSEANEGLQDIDIGSYLASSANRDELLTKIMRALSTQGKSDDQIMAEMGAKLKKSGIDDLTEFSRAVHAEMEALMACARSGVSPVGGTLYCTTFPCHNCAKHIVDAGIKRVVYIEPYPKSRALELHRDSLKLGFKDVDDADKLVLFEPFMGIGPWRFIDLFALKHPEAPELKRKNTSTGKRADDWRVESASPRFGLSEENYLMREKRFISYITTAIESKQRQ